MQYEDRKNIYCRLRAALLALLAAFSLAGLFHAPAAFGQTLEAIDTFTEGADAVVRIRFNARVQYLRHAPVGTADLVQIFFQILVLDDPTAVQTVQESRTSPPHGPFPGVTVTLPVPAVTGSTRQVTVQFADKVTFRVRTGSLNRAIDIVLPGAAARTPTPPAPSPGPAGGAPTPPAAAAPPAPPEGPQVGRFAVNLQTVAPSEIQSVRPVPTQFQDYVVFSSQILRDGKPLYEVDIGYFSTAAEAEKVRQAALAAYPDAHVIDLEARKQEALQAAAAAAQKGGAPAEAAEAPGTAPPPLPSTVPEIDERATQLMTQGREALTAGKAEDAINALDQLLILPPNRFSQDAQELIGVARERAGETAKARAEYELYLKLFPEGEGADRVRQRLANLAPEAPPAAPAPGVAGQPAPGAVGRPAGPAAPLANVTGSISQFYYGGQSKTTTFASVPTGPQTSTLTSNTQSSIVSNVDLTGRYRTEQADTRIVVRDTDAWNFLRDGTSSNLLNAAYIDYRDLLRDYYVRVGRQSLTSGGILGRFDGAVAGYTFAPRWRVNVMGGQPVNILNDSKMFFEGFSIEADNIADHWGGDVYFVNQTADSWPDRRAVGTELRYFGSNSSMYSLLDYDVAFHKLNIATLQGTWQTPGQATLTLLLDYRKAPPIALSNALIGTSFNSIKALMEQVSLPQARDLANGVTADSKQALLGVTQPLNVHWQVGSDFRYFNVGPLPGVQSVPGTPGSQGIPPTPGTGNQYNYDLQATGTNLYSERDINSFVATYSTSSTLKGEQLAYNNLTGLREGQITIEPSFRFYHQTDNTGTTTNRYTPGLRVTYRVSQHVTLEAATIVEITRTTGNDQEEHATDYFYYAGYRFDFQ